MKKVIALTVGALLVLCAVLVCCTICADNKKGFLYENVEALASDEGGDSVGDYVKRILGCPGGNAKCFSGEITVKGVTLSGTWYVQLN